SQDIGVSEEPSADQTDLSVSPPPPYVPPPPLSLSDITAHGPQDRLGHSDVTESLANPVEEGGGPEGGAGFQFDDKEEEVGDLSRRSEEQKVEKGGGQSLGGEDCDADRASDQCLGVLNPTMEVPQMDGIVPEPGLGDQDKEDLQRGFDQSEHKEESPRDAHSYLGKLEQQGGLAYPESIEEPGEEVDGLILYQTGEEVTMGNSLDTETLLGNTAGEEGPEDSTDLADQVDEISEGQVDPVPLMDVPVVQPCEEEPEKHLDIMTVASKAKNGAGLKSEESMDQEAYDGTAEDLNCKNRVLTFSLDQEHKDDLLEQDELKMAATLPADRVDSKPSNLKFSLLPDGGAEKKPQQLELPVKVEETKTETGVDVYPHSSEFKHGKFFSYRVKSETLVTKAEHLHYPVKPETLETKPEDLSPPMKAERSDRNPEVLQFAAYSDGAEIKPEAKPVTLRFSPYPDGAKLKTESEPEDLTAFPHTAIKPEIKPEGLEFSTYPDSSEIKPEAKPEDLDFSAFPEIKAETKQEPLEADSTVLTPKLEQADGLVDSSESLVEKGQLKEERPGTPVLVVEGYSSPRFPPVSMCDVPDSLHESREPTIAQLLQEKALYSFSEWPKDRVIINRLDSICHAILKGKWPSSSEQYDSPGSVVANSCLANSLAQHLQHQHLQHQHHQQHRASFLPTAASGSVPSQPRIQQTNAGLGFSIPPPLTRLPKYMSRGGACGRGAWRLTSLPLLQERLVAPPYLPELKRAGVRRSFDYEAATAKVLSGKSAPSCHTAFSTSSGSVPPPVVAPPSHHHSGAMLINGWQETAIDLTKSSGEISKSVGSGDAAVAPGPGHQLPPPPPITAPLPGSVGMDMAGILQAGLIHPVTGQIVNGSLRGDDSLRRRRGRRRNVEALYSEFTKSRGLHLPETQLQGRVELISHSSVSSSTSSPSPSPSERPAGPTTPSERPAGPPTPSSSSTPTPTQTPPQPEIVAIDREAASKGLMEWLRQNPGYSMDLPSFSHSGAGLLHGFVERPKQRRHRCKDPTKLDINSLTGEERVPVVHRGTGRRLGGAMAPAIKELSRWLDANSEYYVAPDWADVVKHSGFLPEGKFCRILTEPVNRDPGSRRRGRRPRSEMPKPLLSVSDSASSGLGPPLFMNGGLIGSMDSMVAMQNLRGGLHGIPISGIMAAGFPHGFSAAVQGGGASAEDAKNGLSMLPMMLHGIPHPHGGALQQHALFSVGAMMAHAPPHPSSSSSSSSSASKVTTTTAPSTSEAASPSSTTPADASSGSTGGEEEEKGDANKRAEVISSTSRAHLGSAHLGAGSHLTFNPFLIPGMSHGLLYPHMFLPHGGIMALPAMPPGALEPGSPKRRRKRGREEGEREEERESTVKANVSLHPASSSSSPSAPPTSSSPSAPPTSSSPPPPPTSSSPSAPPTSTPEEPDSHGPPEEREERPEEAAGEAAEEQRQVCGEEA
ncbi:chromodomain-helicase-DNA-binding protein 6-like, partial [Anarrhichthys ocellatus]|uniref:chromodomain-helicase-DNA-binding protein 6-like n=1 Tax=Anarrhichthys ocellatus TaxID=433405 RepID=UPI0012EE417A